jgi:hypothetical protein
VSSNKTQTFMEKMTIHRALSELKLIGLRIEKAIDQFNPSGIMQKEKLVNGVHTQEHFTATVTENYQSVNALIDRRNKIKSAIVTANSNTKCSVGGKEMTIAEAINYKAIVLFKKKLIETMAKKHRVSCANLVYRP